MHQILHKRTRSLTLWIRLRSKLPAIQKEDGSAFFGEGYTFTRGKDDLIRKGKIGYVVSFGDALYRALDAVERLREEGYDVGLVNKCTLNVVDEDMMELLGNSSFVLVVEPLNRKSGLGIRFGTWLLERGYTPRYGYIGTTKEGSGGLWEQAYHQVRRPCLSFCFDVCVCAYY
jgi:transketolase C-terminal domain/subunit